MIDVLGEDGGTYTLKYHSNIYQFIEFNSLVASNTHLFFRTLDLDIQLNHTIKNL